MTCTARVQVTRALHGISRFWASETRHFPLDLPLQIGRGLPLQTRHTPLHSSLFLPGRDLLNSGTTSMSVFCSTRLPDELAAAAIGLTAGDRLLPTEPADCPPTTAALALHSCGEARSLQHRCRSFAPANFHRSPSRRSCRCYSLYTI